MCGWKQEVGCYDDTKIVSQCFFSFFRVFLSLSFFNISRCFKTQVGSGKAGRYGNTRFLPAVEMMTMMMMINLTFKQTHI